MSSSEGPQDASLSAASFLASISAGSSTSFGSTETSASSTSAPALPISAKVALIDAQIDALEARIEQAITANAAQLRERAASTRATDRDLNQLWRSINQTSSRLVNVGPHLAPVAAQYNDALAQSSKQHLLISTLSGLLAATRCLEKLEKLEQQSDLIKLRTELPRVEQVVQPFRSHHALQNLPAVIELKARFDRLETKCKAAETTARSADAASHAAEQTPSQSSLDATSGGQTDTADAEPVLSPALKVLDKARAMIVTRGSEGGWKEVRIELDAPAPPPAVETQPPLEASRSSLEAYPERLLREEVAMGPTSLTRNSSTSSNTTARNRHKPKLGARVIRPQDQLGSGPFDAEEDGDGWGLDDDEDDLAAPPVPSASSHPTQASHSLPSTAPLSHPNVAALARESRNSSPSGSVSMHHSMSSSSSQRSVFAVQEPDDVPTNDDDDAWGLGEDDDQKPEADAWDLDEHDVPQPLPPSPKKDKSTAKAGLTLPAPSRPSHARVRSTILAAGDAWDLDEEDVPKVSIQAPKKAETEVHASIAVDPKPAAAQTTVSEIDDAWDLDEAMSLGMKPLSPKTARSPKKTQAPLPAPAEPVHSPVTSATSTRSDGWGLEDDVDVSIDDPWESQTSQEQAAVHSAPSANSNAEHDDPWESSDQTRSAAPTASTTLQAAIAAHELPATLSSSQTQLRKVSPMPAEEEAHSKVPEEPLQAASKDQEDRAVEQGSSESQEQSVGALAAVPTERGAVQAAVPDNIGRSELASERNWEFGAEEGSAAPPPEAHQSATDAAEAKAVNAEPEEDAWEFEESSSSSEADRGEFAPIAATQTADPTPVHPSKEPSMPAPTMIAPLDISQPAQEAARGTAVKQSEPESPASDNGWGSFSDGESERSGDAHAKGQASVAAAAATSLPVLNRSHVHASTQREIASPEAQSRTQLAAVLKEECTISQRSLDLVHLAESTMDSVMSLLTGVSRNEASIDEAEALGGAVFKIFELHRALMPVAHGEVLQDVPSLAMQFFNDCEYLARELSRLATEKGESITKAWMNWAADAGKRWKTKGLPKLEQEAALTRALGQRWFEAQMTAQTKILLDTLMDADGFARTFDNGRFTRCERCVKQVVQTLEQLAKAWQRVLVPSRYHAAMGRLVDLVLQKVLHDVLDLEDIGESESEKLASLIKTLGTLESLFAAEPGSDASAAPLWVPSWFKASYLIEILTGSLVDIEFLAFEAGALVDYSRQELTRLIKALFADTPNRSKLLRRIETASVDVLAY